LSCVFIYLGRRGPVGRFALELSRAARAVPEIESSFVVSSSNEISGELVESGIDPLCVPTFDKSLSSALFTNFHVARRQIAELVARQRPNIVVTLMPHVWSPLMVGMIRACGARYATIVHDAAAHPGDRTAVVNSWLLRDAIRADLIVTLSRNVAERLIGRHSFAPGKLLPLFHPDLLFGGPFAQRELVPGRPLRLLFFGRILKYKGLSMLIDAVELLRAEQFPVQLGVFGSGDLGSDRPRLERLGAEVENRWISDSEVSAILARHDVMVCSHVEASQSGVAAASFGACMPVVALPVGGLTEQVISGQTGILASRVSARSLAAAIRRLGGDPSFYARVSRHLAESGRDRSMDRFLGELLSEAMVP
jgi:glycosyltransferase involved in cell wall biosynthesis